MRRVVLSANTSWYLYNYRRNTIVALQRAGCEVTCLAPRDEYSQRLVDELGVGYIHLKMDNQGSHPLRDLTMMLALMKHYFKLKPQLIFQFTIKNNIYGTLAAAAAGAPVVNNVSGLGTAFIRRGWVGRIVRLLYRLSQPLAYRVFCQNPEDYQLLVQSKLVSERKLYLLPGSGVDLDRFRPGLRQISPGTFRFLYLGRMLADKGLYELIEAFSEVREEMGDHCELWLSGFAGARNATAIDDEQMERWAQLPGVHWLGATDKAEQVLAQVDCLVLPSYREGLPRSLLEANAMELPVVTTDVPGCRNVVTDGVNGLLCTPRSAESLYLAMLALLRMTPEQRLTMGREGRARVMRDFSESVVIRSYLTALEEVCG